MTSRENKVASALNAVGILFIAAGLISGLYYGMNDDFGEFGNSQARVGMGIFIDGLIWGIVFFGFAEIIRLLQGIFNQGEPAISERPAPHPPVQSPAAAKDERREVSTTERNEIEDFYSSKGLTVEDIAVTEKEDFFLVKVDGKKELVELGGFKPVIHPFEE